MSFVGISVSARGGFRSEAIGRFAERAEDNGAAGVFVTERAGDALGACTPAIARTRRVTIGTAITNIYLKHPVSLAGLAVSIDELSGGRLSIGLGVGSQRFNWSALGIHRSDPLVYVREYVTALTTLLQGESCNLKGQHISCVDVVLDMKPRRPVPVFLAGFSSGMLELGGELGDGVIMNLQSLDQIDVSLASILRGARRRCNSRDVSVACVIPCCINDDESTALHAAESWLAGYLRQEFVARHLSRAGFAANVNEARALLDRGDQDAACEKVGEHMARQFVIFGDVQSCAEQLEAYRRAGVDMPIIAPVPIDNRGWEGAMDIVLESIQGLV